MILSDLFYKLFADTIEYKDMGNKILIIKHNRPGVDIRKGSKIRIRKNQAAAIIVKDILITTLRPGTYYLLPEIFPALNSYFNKGYKSIVNIDLYFFNQKLFEKNPWSNKSPITIIDRDFSFIQLRAFGTYSFKIVDIEKFINDVFIQKKKYFTCNMLLHICGFVARAVEESIYESGLVLTDLIKNYKIIESYVADKLKEQGQAFGIEYTEACIDNLSIPAIIEQMLEDKMWKEIESKYNHG